jgi:hypothetical protein
VLEVIEDHRGGTCRAVDPVRFPTTIHCAACVSKEGEEGMATPKRELDLIRERLKWAERLHTGKAEGV